MAKLCRCDGYAKVSILIGHRRCTLFDPSPTCGPADSFHQYPLIHDNPFIGYLGPKIRRTAEIDNATRSFSDQEGILFRIAQVKFNCVLASACYVF